MVKLSLEDLQKNIGYTFNNKGLLMQALSHSSYVNEYPGRGKSNERLEFLGDSILGLITAESFFKHYPNLPEGELTKMRAAAVCEKALCSFSTRLNLGEFLLLGRGEIATGGRNRPSILADAFEALVAAIYLDGGMDAAKSFVLEYVDNAPNEKNTFKDYKTLLQELVQKNPEESVEYVLVGESGPDHDKRFMVEVHLNSNVIGKGEGRSKKNAEQHAAKEALELMGL